MEELISVLIGTGFILILFGFMCLIAKIISKIMNKTYARKEKEFVTRYQEYFRLSEKLNGIADKRFDSLQKQKEIKAEILSLKEKAECFPQTPPRDANYKAILKEIEEQRYLYLVAQGEIDSLRQQYNEIVASQSKDLLTPPGWQFIKPMK